MKRLKASNKRAEYQKFSYGIPLQDSARILGCYTMMVAWHKFDRIERLAIAEAAKVDISKLPFMSVDKVLGHLILYRYTRIPFPFVDYRARIVRAVIKQYNLDQRKRKVVRLRLNKGI